MMVSEEKTEEETWARYHLQGHILSTLLLWTGPFYC